MKKSDLGTTKTRERIALRLSGPHERFAAIIGVELDVTEGQLTSLEEELCTMAVEHELAPYGMLIPGVGP